MTDQVIQSDTPLAGYLQDVGISESDWGIEPSVKTTVYDEKEISDDNHPHDEFVPSVSPLDLRRRMQGRFLQKFKITDSHESRRLRFCGLLKSALQHKIMPRESNQFLERFRYILVSSQLLNSKQLGISSFRSAKRPIDQQIAFDNRHGVWKLISVKTRYLAGSGACIVVVVLLLGWGINKGRFLVTNGELDGDKVQGIAVLVIALCVGLFLFAHAQRTRIRMIRTYTIIWTNRFIYNCQLIDYEISEALKFIQEVEVVARGYQRSSSCLPPIYRLEERALIRHCNRLRLTLYSALNIVIPRIANAVTLTEGAANKVQLERYLDMYNVNDVSVARSNFRGAPNRLEDEEEPSETDLSCRQLQARFEQLHLIRQMFICQLMAVNSDGDKKDSDKWSSIVDFVHSLSDLCGEMAKSIQETTENEILARSNENIDGVSQHYKETASTSELANFANKNLVDELAMPLRNLEARIHLLRRTANSNLNSNAFLEQYEAVGKAIESVLGEWQQGMVKLGRDDDDNNNNELEEEEDSSSLLYQESPSLMSGISGFTVGSNSELATPCGSSSGGGGGDYTMINNASPGQDGFANRLAAVDSELQAQQSRLVSPTLRFSALASAAASIGKQRHHQSQRGLGLEIIDSTNHNNNNNSNPPTMKFAGHRLSKQDMNNSKTAAMEELAKILSGKGTTTTS